MPPAAPKSKRPAKPAPDAGPVVVVIGDHPAASLCAVLLKQTKVDVALASSPAGTPGAGRLALLNPAFFDLHKSLAPLRDTINTQPISTVRFLGPGGESAQTQPRTAATKKAKAVSDGTLAHVVDFDELSAAVRELAASEGVMLLDGSASVVRVGDDGVELSVGRKTLRPALLCVADPADAASTTALDAATFPGAGAQRQSTFKLPAGAVSGDDAALAMCLDLGGGLNWGWLLRLGEAAQLTVQAPATADATALLNEWADLLRAAGLLSAGAARVDGRSIRHDVLPLAGALTRDVVARRTLLLGPAGGFYSASGEDLYPACWSAKFAADVAARAVKADHVQDALGAYRGKWGSTLGDYLRGPQQNLRFLLPLVYKNPTMTDRLADSILLGESLVK